MAGPTSDENIDCWELSGVEGSDVREDGGVEPLFKDSSAGFIDLDLPRDLEAGTLERDIEPPDP